MSYFHKIQQNKLLYYNVSHKIKINHLKSSAAISIFWRNVITRIGQLAERPRRRCEETNEPHGSHPRYELTLIM